MGSHRREAQPAAYAYSDIVSWGFADAIFGSDWDIARSTLKARRYGFAPFIETDRMFAELFADLQRNRIIPEHSHRPLRHFDSTASAPTQRCKHTQEPIMTRPARDESAAPHDSADPRAPRPTVRRLVL